MDRRVFITRAMIAGTACMLPRGIFAQDKMFTAAKKPNIVFFYVDDMGWQDTSEPFYNEITALNKQYHTPNMEKLADEGVKFTQGYSHAVCSPSRVSVMTGLNTARHRVTNWTMNKNEDPVPDTHPTIQAPKWNMNGLCPVDGVENTIYAKALPMFLKDNGYHTIHVGKAHWGAWGTPGENPLNLGFDINIAGNASGQPGSYLGKNNFSASGINGESQNDVQGLEQYFGQDIHLTEALTLEANKAIDRAVMKGTPFYLYMSHYAVHTPWSMDARFFQKYKEMGLSDSIANYASMLEGMDKSLGDIRANLKRRGIEDNTIFVFMSDNGAAEGAPRNLPLRGQKRSPYEGGIRVPLMAYCPGVTKAGGVCNDYVISEDIFPTFLEMAGINNYEQIGGALDGRSFAPMLKDQAAPGDRAIFWHFPHVELLEMPYSTIRKGEWKLIYFYADRRYELYNINEDISEKKNLFKKNKSLARPLAEELRDHLVETKAQTPIERKTGTPMKLPG